MLRRDPAADALLRPLAPEDDGRRPRQRPTIPRRIHLRRQVHLTRFAKLIQFQNISNLASLHFQIGGDLVRHGGGQRRGARHRQGHDPRPVHAEQAQDPGSVVKTADLKYQFESCTADKDNLIEQY